jgi:transposase-like protein
MDDLVSTTGVEHSNERANELRSSARTEQIEVRVRSERHRRWQPDEKLRMVQETLRPGAVLAEVARRHGIGTGLLYTWRREMLATAMAGFPNGVRVRVDGGVDEATLRGVLAALDEH